MYYHEIIKKLIYTTAFVDSAYVLYLIFYNNFLGFFVFIFSILICFILFIDKIYNENNLIMDEETNIYFI